MTDATRTLAPTGHRRPLLLLLGILAILLLPLIAMRFTDDVAWTPFDFAAAALILGTGAVAFDMVMRYGRTAGVRRWAGGAVVLAVALVWAQGAVGIF